MALDIGLIGYGFMGRAHAHALDRLSLCYPDAPDINKSILVGRNAKRTAEAAERFGFDNITDDSAVAIADVDVLYNTAPTHAHIRPTTAALSKGVHVLCEKPLAPTLEDAREMRVSASESDAVAATGFNYRYVPALRLAKRLVDDGVLGNIYRIEGRYMQDWYADPDAAWGWRAEKSQAGAGVVGDQGAHTLDLARWLVGNIDRVCGQLATQITERPSHDGGEQRPVTTDDEYSALAAFENGAIGVFQGSRIATGRKADNSISVYGSEGALEFNLRRMNELRVRGPDDRGFEQWLVTESDDPYLDTWWPPGHTLGWEHTIIHENYEFLTSIDDGTEYRPNFADGFAAQRLVDAIQRSANKQKWVSV